MKAFLPIQRNWESWTSATIISTTLPVDIFNDQQDSFKIIELQGNSWLNITNVMEIVHGLDKKKV